MSKGTDAATKKRGLSPFLLIWGRRRLRSLLRAFQNALVQRQFLLICTSVAITLLLVPTLEVPPPAYQVGDVVVKAVKADRDLLVEDKKTTEEKRQEAADKVLPTYDYDPSVLPEIEGVLHAAFSFLRRLQAGKTQEESDQKRQLEKILGFTLTSQDFDALKNGGLSRRAVRSIVDLVAPLLRRGIVSNKELLLQGGFVARNIKTGEEVRHEQIGSLLDYLEAKEVITEAFRGSQVEGIPVNIRDVTLRMTHSLVFPNLTFNKQETTRERGEARNRVKPVLFQITGGETLLEKGERVTEEDYVKLEALRGRWRAHDAVAMIIGLLLFTSLVVTAFYLFCTKNIKKISLSNKDILFLVLILAFSLGLIRIGVFVAKALADTFPAFSLMSYYYFFPIAAGAMLIRIALNSEVALMYAIVASLFTGVALRDDIFLPVFYLIGSVVGAHSLARCSQRSTLLKGGLLVGLTNVLLILFEAMITARIFSVEILFELLMGLAGGATAGVIVLGMTPIVESVFGYTTDIKLLELANLDQPVLKEVLVRAPGTYHHSMIVGQLVETAAKAINVNPLLARVSAYYHDIGKIKKPEYFVENQNHRDNRHDKLTPSMSSLILVSHVKEGVELAKKHKLGSKIIDAIRQHHGTRLINYFYQKAKEQGNPGVREVDESDFRYLGPKPQTKEAGLVMLADAVEAASRTLDDPTPARIQGLVQRITNEIFIDGQLDECELTLKDLHEIAKSYNIVLNAVYHHRIEYPEAQQQEVKNGGDSARPAKVSKGQSKRGETNSRKDIKRLGVSR